VTPFAEARAGGRDTASSRHRTPAPVARPDQPGGEVVDYKVDAELTRRKTRNALERTPVIVTLVPGAELPREFRRFMRGVRKLDIINGEVLDLPNGVIRQLESRPEVFRLHYDRPIRAHNYRTSVTIGARQVRETLGYTGAGIGIAVIDSGITAWHDDLTRGAVTQTYPYGNQRVSEFVDFVNGASQPYDDNGHGTHVAGIIAGNGYDSSFEKAGVAPDASLVALKVLDAQGQGTISRLIAALNWVAANRAIHNIRVVNMSVGAGIFESYHTDPLTQATKQLTSLGITVVAAAGNLGRNASGQKQWGGITAPGNAPWVLTVGATSTQGTNTRVDDVMGGYSSLGPTRFDYHAKPDLAAPGTGTVSLAVPGSAMYATRSASLVAGSTPLGYMPYLGLTGTSMAAPVVSGTVALMLQANPHLTPNLIKAILQYTSQPYPGYKPLEQGAGFLNTLGAVRLARFYALNGVNQPMPTQRSWSKSIIWGNRRLRGGYLNPRANAWADNVVWGTVRTSNTTGDNVVWGTLCPSSCDNVVWGTGDASGQNVVWGTMAGGDNVVWGTAFGDHVVWGTTADDNVVWGTADRADDNVVWGTDCLGGNCDNVVWGTADSDNVVWGTAAPGDNVVWGTSFDNVVWGTSFGDNVVWGTSADAWSGSASDPNHMSFPDTAGEPLPDLDLELSAPAAIVDVLEGI
jgi:serine protease AprX